METQKNLILFTGSEQVKVRLTTVDSVETIDLFLTVLRQITSFTNDVILQLNLALTQNCDGLRCSVCVYNTMLAKSLCVEFYGFTRKESIPVVVSLLGSVPLELI